ncbi:hypothetical protein SCANM63S_07249 [Streptomyces canarius]
MICLLRARSPALRRVAPTRYHRVTDRRRGLANPAVVALDGLEALVSD